MKKSNSRDSIIKKHPRRRSRWSLQTDLMENQPRIPLPPPPPPPPDEEDALKWQQKLLWLPDYTIPSTGGLFVTAGYSTVLVDNEIIDANYLTKHLLNSASMLINTRPDCIPVRLIRYLTTPCCIYSAIYSLIFSLIFFAIYSLLGGTNVEGKLYIFRNCSQGNNYYWNDFKCTTVPNRLISYLRPQ